jgi:hypothetical protein
MNIQVQLEKDEVVEDWMAFRQAFEEAAEKLDLTLVQIVNTKRGRYE